MASKPLEEAKYIYLPTKNRRSRNIHPMSNSKRYFPGPQGTEAEVVVPMTDFSIIDADRRLLPETAREELKRRTLALRSSLQSHSFATGNKIASLLKLLHDESTPTDKRLMLYGGPTLNDFRITMDIPQSSAIRRASPRTPRELFELIGDRELGGNASNILRNEMHLARAGIGAKLHKVFTPRDAYLDAWMRPYLRKVGPSFEFHELKGMKSRYGAGFPYDDDSKKGEQRFATNTPQDATVEAMRQHVINGRLNHCDFIVVSEGIGELLKQYRIEMTQLFNPTSSLHAESALEVLKRFRNRLGMDEVFVNDKEMDDWIRTMENRLEMGARADLPEATFPTPFRKKRGLTGIDTNAISLINTSHQRWLNIMPPPETDYITCHSSVGCGPNGGQYVFQCQGKHYIGCADTPTQEGARRLIESVGKTNGVRPDIKEVTGAGDASFTATIISKLYTPLEDILRKRDPSLTTPKLRIAAAAFHAMLGRVFGELSYRTKARDLSGVPYEAFPRLFDTVLDKAVAAAHTLTNIPKRAPQRVYEDREWEIHFTMWELEQGGSQEFQK